MRRAGEIPTGEPACGAVKRLGLTLPLNGGLRLAESLTALAQTAEHHGYTDLWSSEVAGTDAFSPLAAIAGVTHDVRLGTGIAGVFTRPPALLAMSAATIQALSGGRFVLGLGVSTPLIVENWMGLRYRSALARTRETVQALRLALQGERVDLAGAELSTAGFRLSIEVDEPVPVHLAALGPRMVRLAGEIADGIILFLVTPDGAADASGAVRAAAASSGRPDADSIEVVARIPVALGGSEAERSNHLRRWIVPYALARGYAASLARQGFGDEIAVIARRWAEQDRDGAARAVSSHMLDQLCILDPAACADRIAEYRRAGVTTPVLLPIPVRGTSTERLEQLSRFVVHQAASCL